MATVQPAGSGQGRGGERLKSWKEIAAFFGADERTVRRWETHRGLPVHRVPGGSRGTVYAEAVELERWLQAPKITSTGIEPAIEQGRPRAFGRRHVLAGAGAAAIACAGGWWVLRSEPASLSPEAATLLSRGVESSRLGTAESTAEAVGLLREATRLAPDNAAAWGALAIAYFDGQYFLDDPDGALALRKSRDAAHRALRLDPHCSSARAALALAIPSYGSWATAESALRSVLRDDPQQFETRLELSRLLANVGRREDALTVARPLGRGPVLRPNIEYWLGQLLWQVGLVAESDRLLEQAMQRWPRNYMVWFTRFWQLLFVGRPDAALSLLARTALRPIGIPEWNFALLEDTARAAATRSPAHVHKAVAAHMAAARQGAGLAENAIQALAFLGAADDAFAVANAYYLSKGFAVNSTRYSSMQGAYTRPDRRRTSLLFSPATALLRRDPRFDNLVAQVGLAAYWRQTGTRPDTARETA